MAACQKVPAVLHVKPQPLVSKKELHHHREQWRGRDKTERNEGQGNVNMRIKCDKGKTEKDEKLTQSSSGWR